MQKIQIHGGKELSGTIKISGAKNAAVALIPAAILCDEEVSILNVPDITDRDALIRKNRCQRFKKYSDSRKFSQ